MLHPWRNPLIVLLGAKASRSKKTVYFNISFQILLNCRWCPPCHRKRKIHYGWLCFCHWSTFWIQGSVNPSVHLNAAALTKKLNLQPLTLMCLLARTNKQSTLTKTHQVGHNWKDMDTDQGNHHLTMVFWLFWKCSKVLGNYLVFVFFWQSLLS